MDLMTLYSHLKAKLQEAGIDNAGLEARWMLRQAAVATDADLISQQSRTISPECSDTILSWLERRLASEPLSRILGEREFWGLSFTVTPDVLDPRPDTETIVEMALKTWSIPPARILDLGTGSGCLAITLAHVWPKALVTAVDVSDAAAKTAAINVERHNMSGQITLRKGSWYDALNEHEQFDLIVSNPPYIPDADIQNLDQAVREYDPILALSGGRDGFDSYRIIVGGLKKHFSQKGRALLEIGFDQSAAMTRLVRESGLSLHAIYPDLAGIPRVADIRCGDK